MGCRTRETPVQFEWTQVLELMISLYVSGTGEDWFSIMFLLSILGLMNVHKQLGFV